jgi:hypothetical protein
VELHEFNLQMKRMRETFGEKAYGAERTKIIHDTFERLPDGIFRYAVDELIMSCRVTPLQSEIADVVSRIAAQRRPLMQLVRRNDCTACNGFGYFIFENDNGGTACGSCDCESGVALRTRNNHPIVNHRTIKNLGYSRQKKLTHELHQPHRLLPPALQGLCIMIKENTADSRAFETGCLWLGVSVDEVWQVYQAFIEKRPESEPCASICKRVRGRYLKLSELIEVSQREAAQV